MQEFIDLARKILAEQLDLNPQEITMDTNLEDLDADSIDVVEMIMALEDAYDVEFPEEGLENLSTFGTLVTTLYRHLEQVQNG
ncbi:MAG: acyl carrier protein [Syntrophomonadaceae bacterium]